MAPEPGADSLDSHKDLLEKPKQCWGWIFIIILRLPSSFLSKEWYKPLPAPALACLFSTPPALHCLIPTFWKPSITLQSHMPLITLSSLLKMSCPSSLPTKCLNEVRYLLLQEDLPNYCQSGWELLHLLPDPVSASITALTTTGIPLAFLTSPWGRWSYKPSSHQQKQKEHSAPRPSPAHQSVLAPPHGRGKTSLIGPSWGHSSWAGRRWSWKVVGDHFMISVHVLLGMEPAGHSLPSFQLLNQGSGSSRFLDSRGRKLDMTGLASAFWYQLHPTGMVFPILNILPQSETWREGRMMKSWTSDLHTDLESFVHDALYWLCRSENLLAWFPETSERMTPVLVPSPEFKNTLELSNTHLESLTFKWWLKS